MTETVELTHWEKNTLALHASTQSLQYLGHYYDAGLFRREVETMNAWVALADKLSEREPSAPLPYRGTRRNGFNPDVD